MSVSTILPLLQTPSSTDLDARARLRAEPAKCSAKTHAARSTPAPLFLLRLSLTLPVLPILLPSPPCPTRFLSWCPPRQLPPSVPPSAVAAMWAFASPPVPPALAGASLRGVSLTQRRACPLPPPPAGRRRVPLRAATSPPPPPPPQEVRRGKQRRWRPGRCYCGRRRRTRGRRP